MHIDIIIINYKTLSYLKALLKNIAQTAPQANVIVVDNDSGDASIQWLAEQDLTVIFNDENLGFATACNQGGAAGQAEVIGFLNPDIILPDDWFYHISSAFEDPRVDLAAPKLADEKGRSHPTISIQAPHGACLFVRRAAFAKLDGFDENYFFGWEDVDFVRRARLENMLMRGVPEMTVIHLGRKAPRPAEWGGDYCPESRAYHIWRWTEMIVLKYIGKGAYITSIPSNDLTAEDMIHIMEDLGKTRKDLIATGLYEAVERKKPLRVFKRRKKKVKAKAKAKAKEPTTVTDAAPDVTVIMAEEEGKIEKEAKATKSD